MREWACRPLMEYQKRVTNLDNHEGCRMQRSIPTICMHVLANNGATRKNFMGREPFNKNVSSSASREFLL